MQQAAQLQIQTLYLFTEDQQAFYQRLGWQFHHTELYEGHWVSVMQWQPNGAAATADTTLGGNNKADSSSE